MAVDKDFDVIQIIIDDLRNIGFSEEEIQHKLDDDSEFKKIYVDTINVKAEQMLDFFKENLEEVYNEEKKDEDIFINHLNELWKKCFKYSDVLYIISFESAVNFHEYMRKVSGELKKEYQFRYSAISVIHGRCLQIYKEIDCLNKNGYADGAFARWRSMYELSVVAFFLSVNNEETSKAYIESGTMQNNNYYDWAIISNRFKNKKKIMFGDLQNFYLAEHAEIWRKQYALSSKIIHASAIATYDRLSANGVLDVIPIGSSDYGINIPAEHAAITLLHVTTYFIMLYPHDDGYVHFLLMCKWLELTRDEYLKVSESSFDKQIK